MAYSYTAQANGVGIPFNYTRGNPLPLDSWSLFPSLAEAETYAKSNPVSYPGQVISIITNGSPIAYLIAGGHIYVNGDTIPEGKEIGDEDVSTRTLVRLGTKKEIEDAQTTATLNWIES